MQPTTINYYERSFSVHSRLSFVPLIETWKQKMSEDKDDLQEYYGYLLDKVSQVPELLQPIDDLSVLQRHRSLIAMMMATIFPVTASDKKDLYAVSIPFTYTSIYYSTLFKTVFLRKRDDMIIIPSEEADKKISEERLIMAYQMILNKYYGFSLKGNTVSVHPYEDPDGGLKKYLELELDSKFVTVTLKGALPIWEHDHACSNLADLLQIPELQEKLPLTLFEFEGMVIIKIRDVTEREVISNLKNQLLTVHSFADHEVFASLQEQMQQLIGLADARIGIAPFFKINNHYIFSEQLSRNSFVLKHTTTNEEKTRIFTQFAELFAKQDDFVIIPTITRQTLEVYPSLKYVVAAGGKSVIICPLKSDNELIGLLTIVSDIPGKLGYEAALKIEPAISLFILALEKSAENLDTQVDRVIKEQFTAVQSSVEWKFTEAALEYIHQRNNGEDNKIESIVFDQVFPLYGAMDIRNSSTERSHAIQQDLLEQLGLARSIVEKAMEHTYFPLLNEIVFRIDKYVYNVSNILFSGDEIAINTFLKEEIVKLFNHLKIVVPEIRSDIVKYFSSMDESVQMLYKHRSAFEESITTINKELAKFIDKEQVAAQKIFPHYFERFVTDGVDFNIYMGQSISPNRVFDHFYLKNIKLWQLATLAKGARMAKNLEQKLSLPLETTQLILAHSNPISISFRTAERKFDVDGAYNIRYEIIKKRIDKVRIKDTNERLTQPGKIAIVFSLASEAREYSEYIEFITHEGLLTGETEKFELEELQGVSGLKALRVAINFDENQEGPSKDNLSLMKVKTKNR